MKNGGGKMMKNDKKHKMCIKTNSYDKKNDTVGVSKKVKIVFRDK